MVTQNADMNQRDGGLTSAPSISSDQLRSRAGNTVFKSGPLLISSKGIGWTSWKKRWFILTRTSLVFFRSDPSIIPQKGSEVNLTLGGIDLNSSGSVVIKEDKKLLTVFFPDGRDGRAFTLKAETSEDLYDWKTALENALAQAPSAALVMGQNGIFRNDQTDTVDGSSEQSRDQRPGKSSVIGRPILLALEDIDGAPSFLEKACRFIEQYGVRVEGIFRQAAYVDDVHRRVQEYEQGNNEFSPEEDVHIIADCIKYVLRELPSSPVPASCCKALLEACRTDRGVRLNAMRAAISETFSEPNRHLLERMLKMMRIVVSHQSENRMTTSNMAACMAPLLLAPLLKGDCELDNDFNMGGDGSVQLMQAAAAANHAQAIVITLLEEYKNIFGDDGLQEDSISPELYSQSDESGSEDEEPTDDDGFIDSEQDLDADTEDDPEGALSETVSESTSSGDDDQYDNKDALIITRLLSRKQLQTLTERSKVQVMLSEGSDSDFGSHQGSEDFEPNQKTSRGTQTSFPEHDNVQRNGNSQTQSNTSSVVHSSGSCQSLGVVPTSTSLEPQSTEHGPSLCIAKSTNKSNEPVPGVKRPTVWGRTSARKDLSMESIDYKIEDEDVIQRLEITKNDLQNRIAKEAKENAVLHASLERRRQALHERRVALEQDVARLQEQLQKEKDLRTTMEAGLNMPLGCLPISANIDKKTKAELEEIAQAEADVINLKQKAADLQVQLNQQRKTNYGSVCESCSQHQQSLNDEARMKDKKEVEDTTAASQHERSIRSEDISSRTASGKVRTQHTPCFSKQQPDSKINESSKPIVAAATSSSMESITVAPDASSNSKKSGAKVEDTSCRTDGKSPPSFPKQQLDSTIYESGKPVVAAATSSSVEPVTVALDASSNSKKSGAKVEDTSYRTDGEKVRAQNLPSLSKKQLTEKQQLGLTIHESTKSGVAAATSSVEPVTDAPTASSNSKKSGTKLEDTSYRTDGEKVRAHNPPSLSKKQLTEKQQLGLTIHDSTKSGVAAATSSVEPVTDAPTASSNSKKSSMKIEDTSYRTDGEKVRAQNPPSLSKKQLTEKQQLGLTIHESTKSGVAAATSSVEPVADAPTASSNSKKSETKVEQGNVSTSSALAKLTTRLNFLKERRTQVVNELQNLEHGRGSDGQLLGILPVTNTR